MLTGMLVVRNMLYGETNNFWVVNAEEEYHEEMDIGNPQVDQVLGFWVAALYNWILKFRTG